MDYVSAQIIQFPRPREQSPVLVTPLAAAMAALAAALAEQKQAVGTWRSAIAELDRQVKATERGLRSHRTALGALGVKVSGLHEQASQMGRWSAAASAVD